MIECPRCGHLNPDNATNCKQCRINLRFAMENRELLADQRVAKGDPNQTEQPRIVKCPVCGYENAAGVTNCTRCNVNLGFVLDQPDDMAKRQESVSGHSQQVPTAGPMEPSLGDRPAGNTAGMLPPPRQGIRLTLLIPLALIVGAVLFLLSFHIVQYDDGLVIIPKKGLSFAETFVSVDDLIDQYNSRTLTERLRGEGVNMHLIAELEKREIIGTSSSSSSGSGSSPTTTQRFTLAMYNQIQDGMSYSRVVGILGSAGQEMSRSTLAGITTVAYSWQNSDGGNMLAMFQNDKLIQKSQFGLR